MKITNIIILLCLLLFTACNDTGKMPQDSGASIEMKYAEFLTLKEHEGVIVAEVLDPWHKGKILHRYVMIRKGEEVSKDSLPEGDVIRIPVDNAIVYSSVHIALLNELGGYDKIKGVCDLEYINMPKLHEDVKKGSITDIGNSMTPSIEKIMDLHPGMIMLSPFENSGSYGKLGKLDIPLIECADYMETSALGRAEWMRFYGMLTGKQDEADSIFAAIEKDYIIIRDSVVATKNRPTVVTEMKQGSTWYVAGGNSYIGRMLKDAGADYIFKDDKNNGATPYDPEVVFDRGQKAQFWLIKYGQAEDMTINQLADEWAANASMEAIKNNNVFAVNLSKVPYYEETPFHPNLLLRDYVFIFHPELQNGYKPRYYKRVNRKVLIGSKQ